MTYNQKRKIVNSTMYIVFALVVTAVLCITVLTFVNANRNIPTPPDPPPVNNNNQNNNNQNNNNNNQNNNNQTTEPGDNGDDCPTDVVTETYFVLPANGHIMVPFSIDVPVFSLTTGDFRLNPGISISVPVGSPVFAAANGLIVDIFDHPLMGRTVAIDHGDGLVSYYKGLSTVMPAGIEVGVAVDGGQTIAATGDTALIRIAESDSLHFEMRQYGQHVNPMEFLDFSQVNAPPETSDDNGGNEPDNNQNGS